MPKKSPVPSTERHDLAALPMPSVDHHTALASSKTVALQLAEPKTRRDFDALPDTVVNRPLIAAYPALHTAAKEASAEYLSAESLESDASVPLASVQLLTDIRRRVYTLIDYHLGEDLDIARALAVIRAGQGYKDLIDDVTSLLKMRETHIAALKHDRKNFRMEDATEGAQHCDIIQRARLKGQRPATKKAGRIWATAFYALREAHEEVTAVGRFLDRQRPDVDARWPSLYVNVRKPAKAKPTVAKGS